MLGPTGPRCRAGCAETRHARPRDRRCHAGGHTRCCGCARQLPAARDLAAAEPPPARGHAGRALAAERLGVKGRFEVLERQRVVEDIGVGDVVGVPGKRRGSRSPPTAVGCVSPRRSTFFALSGLEGTYAVPLTGLAIYSSWWTRLPARSAPGRVEPATADGYRRRGALRSSSTRASVAPSRSRSRHW